MPSDQTLTVRNPASGLHVGAAPVLGPEDVAELVNRARRAQPIWAGFGPHRRRDTLHRMRRWVVDNAERIIDTVVSETAKPRDEVVLAEIGHCVNAFGYWADVAADTLRDQEIRSGNPFLTGKRLILRQLPVGVVGVIGPWNFPFTNAIGDCIPALAAGNAVVLKPSEVTPLTPLLIAEGFYECGLPEDVFTVATGVAETGQALIDHVDQIMFTGSTSTGRAVMARAADTLTPVSLELGGKDAMIVLSDADLERAANYAVFGSMQNAGQVCIAIERVYVEDQVYDAFVERVRTLVSQLRVAPPGSLGTSDIGPMIHPPQARIVASHVTDAVQKGARILHGGHVEDSAGCCFAQPTVLVDVDHSMLVMREETFGPVLPIMRVTDERQAIELTNDSAYGLSASVFTQDAARGESVARQLEVGAVCINDAQINFLALELPMAGWKQSGVGSRHGIDGIRKFTRPQSIVITPNGAAREPFMFPYDAAATAAIMGLLENLDADDADRS